MKIPSSLAAIPFAAAVFSCSASRQGIPPISMQDNLAVVAFHFDGFFDPVAAPDEYRRAERGPGISPRADAGSLDDEQVALDSVWAKFQAGLPAALGASIEPLGGVVSNPAYARFPMRDPSRSKGLEPSGGFKPVSIADTAGLRNLALALGANTLVLVETWADYDTTATSPVLAAPAYAGNIPGWKSKDSAKVSKDSTKLAKAAADSAKISKDSTKPAKVSLDSAKAPGGDSAKQAPKAQAKKAVKVVFHVVLRFYQVGKGVYWTGRYMAGTKALAELKGGLVPASFLPGHLAEAVNPILMRISQDVAIGRGMSD